MQCNAVGSYHEMHQLTQPRILMPYSYDRVQVGELKGVDRFGNQVRTCIWGGHRSAGESGRIFRHHLFLHIPMILSLRSEIRPSILRDMPALSIHLFAE